MTDLASRPFRTWNRDAVLSLFHSRQSAMRAAILAGRAPDANAEREWLAAGMEIRIRDAAELARRAARPANA
jgi:hypothetical protein